MSTLEQTLWNAEVGSRRSLGHADVPYLANLTSVIIHAYKPPQVCLHSVCNGTSHAGVFTIEYDRGKTCTYLKASGCCIPMFTSCIIANCIF